MATGLLARYRRTAHEFNLEPSDLGKPRAERLPLLRQWAIDATCQVPAAPRGCSVTTWMLPPYFTAGLKSMEKLTEWPASLGFKACATCIHRDIRGRERDIRRRTRVK